VISGMEMIHHLTLSVLGANVNLCVYLLAIITSPGFAADAKYRLNLQRHN
jgi:hypothetical protein